MVDQKETVERTVETEAGLDQAARKVWIKPRLEVADLYETEGGNGAPADTGPSIS